MFTPRTLRTFGELVQFLVDAGIPHRVDVTAQTLEAGPVRIAWEPAAPFLHITHPLMTAVPADRVAALALAILASNHEAKFPVLDFDAATSTVFLRTSVPLLVDGIRVDLLQAVLGGVDARAAQLRAVLARVLA